MDSISWISSARRFTGLQIAGGGQLDSTEQGARLSHQHEKKLSKLNQKSWRGGGGGDCFPSYPMIDS